MHRFFPRETEPQAEQSFPVQVVPVAARLLKGAKTVAVETAIAVNVCFGPDRAAALATAAAATFATVPPLTLAYFQVPEGSEFIALSAATDMPFTTGRYGLDTVKVSVSTVALDPNTLQPIAA